MKHTLIAALLLLACVPIARAADAPATFTAAPSTGNAPLPVTITWNVPNGTQCAAGGAWSGAKAASGSEVVTLAVSGTLTLACTVPGPVGPGQASLNWTASTQNTDGTPYTDPKGFYLYSGATTPAATKSPLLTPDTRRAYVLAPLPAGATWYFSLSAVNQADVEGPRTIDVAAVIKGTPTSVPWTGDAIAINVTPAVRKPMAPVLQVVGE